MTLSDSLDHHAGNSQLAGEDASTPMGSNRWPGLQGDAQNLLFYLRGQHRPRPLPLLPLVKGSEPLRVAITVGRDSPVRWAMARVGILGWPLRSPHIAGPALVPARARDSNARFWTSSTAKAARGNTPRLKHNRSNCHFCMVRDTRLPETLTFSGLIVSPWHATKHPVIAAAR